jgi:hypothetical protein
LAQHYRLRTAYQQATNAALGGPSRTGAASWPRRYAVTPVGVCQVDYRSAWLILLLPKTYSSISLLLGGDYAATGRPGSDGGWHAAP